MLTVLMIYHGLVLGILLLSVVVMAVNLFCFSTLKNGAQPKRTPKISVLVPARNEEHRIGPCAGSLAVQDYPDYEVLILNDNSTDDTEGVLRRAGFGEDGRLRMLRGTPLPPGWMGKSWACHQLSQAATGDYLLFTDADTWHGPETLKAAMLEAERTRADLLSAWPRQITGSFSEMLVIPMLYVFGFTTFPHVLLQLAQDRPQWVPWLQRETLENLGGANGQFLLFRREAYEAIGGHEAVKGNMVEDLSLGRAVAARIPDGMRLVNCDNALGTCRMYTNFRELWDGFSKNAMPAFKGSKTSFWIFILIYWAIFSAPFLWLFSREFRTVALVESGLILLIRGVLSFRFKLSWLSCPLHFLGNSLMVIIALNSLRLVRTSGVMWKGRVYGLRGDNAEVEGVKREV
ncbi:MAG: glycosyltransferase [Chthoniobacteraceae bacterium]